MVRLSILVCTIESRKSRFDILMSELERQKTDEVEILVESDKGVKLDPKALTIGAKRNLLLDRAEGDYLCFIDDDDWVDGEYVLKILRAIDSDPDCVQLIGIMNTNGFNQVRFEHSIAHNRYYDHMGVYYRYPNHLNPIRREIAQQFDFPESNFGEDTDWATQIRDSGLIQREEPIDRPIYHYRYSTQK